MPLIQTQSLLFRAVEEARPGPVWQSLFREFWPAYQSWYLQNGDAERPYYLPCVRALRTHMPELLPTYEALVELAGGGDLEARFLSLFCPPPYVSGCSQAVLPGEHPILVRNYDYPPQLCEGLILKTAWNGRQVIGMSDCAWVCSTASMRTGWPCRCHSAGGGTWARASAPLIVRYVLETCSRTFDAAAALARIPSGT